MLRLLSSTKYMAKSTNGGTFSLVSSLVNLMFFSFLCFEFVPGVIYMNDIMAAPRSQGSRDILNDQDKKSSRL